jgi:hypothetical protein
MAKRITEIGLGGFISAKNTGRNVIELTFEHGTVLQSYSTAVAAKIGRQLYLSQAHDSSVTTNKHVKQFTGLSAEERRRGLADGSIKEFE